MRRLTHSAILSVVVLAIAQAAFAGAPKSDAAGGDLHLDRCPTLASAQHARAAHVELLEATRGVLTRLPTVFRDLPANGRFSVQIEAGFRITRAPTVTSTNEPRDHVRFFSVAGHFCGREIARLSWAFEVWFPFAPNASQGGYVVFVVKSATGWRLYGSVGIN